MPPAMIVPRRLVVLGLFCLFTASSAIQWITFSPIASESKRFFGMSTNQLNMLSSVFMLTFVLFGIAGSTCFETVGIRQSLLIGTGFNALGAALKVCPAVVFPNFGTALAGQFVASLGQIATLSTPPLIAAVWFEPSQRTVATSIASNANNVGTAIGMFLPPLLVSEARHGAAAFLLLLGLELALCLLVVGSIYRWVPERPSNGDALRESEATYDDQNTQRHPPQAAAAANEASPLVPASSSAAPPPLNATLFRQRLAAVLRTAQQLLCHNRAFLFLLLSFSVSIGTVWTFSSVLAQILAPFGVSESLAGLMGAANILVGTLVAVGVSSHVDRVRRYKLPLLLCCLGNAVSIAALQLAVTRLAAASRGLQVACFAIYIAAGIAQLSTIPIAFEFALELSHADGQLASVPGVLLMVGGNFAALVLLTTASAMMGTGNATAAQAVQVLTFLLVASGVGGVCALVPAEDLRRLRSEQHAAQTARR